MDLLDDLLEKDPSEIDWRRLCYNSNAMQILKENPENRKNILNFPSTY